MNRTFAVLAMAAGGIAVGLVLTPTDFVFGDVDASQYAAAAALVALAVTAVPRRHLAAVVAGAVLIAGAILVPDDVWSTYVRAVGAGLLLGGLASRGGDKVALISGVLAGSLMIRPLESSVLPQRYADYMPEDDAFSVARSDLIPLLFIVVMAVLLLMSRRRVEPRVETVRSRELFVGAVIPVTGLFLYSSMTRAVDTMQSMQGRWLLGIVMVPIVIACAAFLPGRTGTVLLPVLAFVVARDPNLDWSGGIWLWAVAPLILVGAGAWFGHRQPNPIAGVAVIALVTASAFLDAPPWDVVRGVAVLFVLPFAAAYAIAGCAPTIASVSTTASTLPLVVTVPLVATFGWTAYTPLTDSPAPFDGWHVLSTGVATAGVVVTGIALWLLRRGRPATP